MFHDNRDFIILNENAYFFKKNKSSKISKSKIESIFRTAASGREGKFLLKHINQSITVSTTRIFYSICVFKFNRKPSFIIKDINNWIETKLAYLLAIEIDDYVIISKKNVSGLKELYKIVTPIDYDILSSLFIDNDTSFENFVLQNMNISDSSVRNKSISSQDLKENFSTLGANSYVLKNLRVKNKSEKVTLALNTSRINKFGTKNGIEDFIQWAFKVKMKIESHSKADTFISIFAKPCNYGDVKDSLIPIAILLDTNQMFQDFDSGRIESFKVKNEFGEREVDLVKYLNQFSRLCQIKKEIVGSQNLFKIENIIANDFYLNLNSKSITLSSKKLNRLILTYDNGTEESIVKYINRKNDFIVNFESLETIYTKRKLFKDNKLLGNIDYFIKILKPFKELAKTTSEKGEILASSTGFDKDSVFYFVENQFKSQYDFFICDDMGREWADHIGISDGRIALFHSKSKKSYFSAADFQDIIGQAQKNFGNITPSLQQLDRKKISWSRKINNNSKISKLRNGTSVNKAVETWKTGLLNPNIRREVYLVIDFISKSDLEDRLVKLKKGQSFKEKNEVIQILWFISSLISSSYELGIETYICCKP